MVCDYVGMNYTINPRELPPHWEIQTEEHDVKEVTNRYRHERLTAELLLLGVHVEGAPDSDRPPTYEIWITAAVDESENVDYQFETADAITDFETAQDRALALMTAMETQSQTGEEEYVQAALHQINATHHERQETDPSQANSAWDCPVCGVDTAKYRGENTFETIQQHFMHMNDEIHTGWSMFPAPD